MSNFKELLFMEDDDWMKVTARIESYKEKIKLYSGDADKSKVVRGYYLQLNNAYVRRDEIEHEILNKYNQRAMAARGSLDSTGDDFLVQLIAKNGYLTGFKF